MRRLLAFAALLAALAGAARAAPADPALERYEAGDYAAAARLGLRALQAEPAHAELRLAVANSLSWTGRYDEALAQYRLLLGTGYDGQARVGIGDVARYRGRADLSEPYYREALQADPRNAEAQAALGLAARELRPAVTLRLGRMEDNQDVSRDEVQLGYRYWNAGRSLRFDLGALSDRVRTPQGNWTASGFSAAAFAPRLPLSPRVEALVYDTPALGQQLFGSVQVEPVADMLRLRAGRVDWGRLAFTGGAALDGLTAHLLEATGEAGSPVGVVRGRLNYYDISDGNSVTDGELQLTPHWQPLPWRMQWFTGIYGRSAEREDARYWSPDPAYGVVFLGVQRGWYLADLDLTASIRRGFAVTESARDTWAAGLAGRYWLARALAIGIEGWAIDTPRPAPYRAFSLGAFVQTLW